MREVLANAGERRLPLLSYLEQHGWKMLRRGGGDEVAGLCPLHRETQASFYVNRRKNVFYCFGCGRGGDLIQLREVVEGISFRQAPARLRHIAPLEEAVRFYQQRMHIGYAPGACLRAHLEDLGYAQAEIEQSGLLNARGCDRFWRCLTFPLDRNRNLYGRGIGDSAVRHRFLPRPKGGLYGWNRAGRGWDVIVTEGVLDVAALWQAGFGSAVGLLGVFPNPVQMAQLYQAPPGNVYLCLDGDDAGRNAARALAAKLRQAGVGALRVELPEGDDPNSFFASGATAADFQRCLGQAR